MDWIQISTIVGSNIAMFMGMIGLLLWFRSESRNDWRHMDAKLDSTAQAIHQEIKAIHQEIKDFHGRLCAIEERRKERK